MYGFAVIGCLITAFAATVILPVACFTAHVASVIG